MKRKFFRFFSANILHIRICILAFIWIAGVISGVMFAVRNKGGYVSTVISFAQQDKSLPFILFMQFALLAVLWYLSYRKRFLWIYAVCFFRMLLFGFCAGSVYCVFGSAGWLVCALMLFSQIVILVPVFWFSMKIIVGELSCRTAAWLWMALLFVTVSVCDCFVISPFLSSVISSF